MAPNRYTELFFVDEATGLAAGHRPCAECRHGRFLDFRDAWAVGNRNVIDFGRASADVIDAQLHADRLCPERSKRTFHANLDELPDGVLVIRNGGRRSACLLWQGRLLAWSPSGYSRHLTYPRAEEVQVLTPRSTVAAMRAGYVPEVHPTASRA